MPITFNAKHIDLYLIDDVKEYPDMRYEEIEGFLSAQEISAIEILEGCGWEIFTETKIEDTHKKDGGRIRTFALAGRYDVAVVCRKVDQLIPVEEDEETDIEPEQEDVESEPEIAEPDEEEPEPDEEEKENFWIDESNWKRTSRNVFFELVQENVAELKSAPDAVQGEVYKKWTRFFDKEDWPL